VTAIPPRYLAPGRVDRLTARAFRRFVRLGVGVRGARELRVVGRTSGQVRSTVVNLLDVGGRRYLVAPRGTTDWVRNLRAAGGGELRLGRHAEQFQATEVADEDKGPILRAYLERWAFEVGRFFEGLTGHSTPDQLAAHAGGFPVFTVTTTPARRA